MAEESRTTRSLKNSSAALFEQIVYNILSFVCRTVFIYTLGKTYLGFSGLFSDILTLLSLAELGMGTAIIYSMYKPAAENDFRQVAALLNLYKVVYTALGVGLTLIGLCLTPLLNFIISDIPELPELPLIYILYLLNTTGSYFLVYKKSILIVDQRSDVISIISIIANSLKSILQIITLLLFSNFILYLVLQLVFTMVNNVGISCYVGKHYEYLKEYKHERVDKQTQTTVFENVKAMFVSKLSSAVVTSTDNLLISKFVSTVLLGYYSNYTLFTTMIRTVVSKIFEALTGSVGNLVALESPDTIYKSFKRIWFVNFWIVGFCCSSLFVLVNPFIKLWIGESYLLDMRVVLMVCINLYMRLMRNTFITFTDTYGLFAELKVKSVCEAIINLVVSLVLVGPCKLGIYGILLGTLISNMTTNFWYEPYLLFKEKFGVGIHVYFRMFASYFLVMAISAGMMYYICDILLAWNSWIAFFVKLIMCCVFINLVYVVVYGRTKEFAYFWKILKGKIFSNLRQERR
jgi:O-antigen/teichoic acid export membrane protein